MPEEKKKITPKLSAIKAQKDPPLPLVEPDEWYKAEFEDCELNQGNFGPYLKFKFKLLDGQKIDGDSAKGMKVTRLMDATLSPSKPLWLWIKVMTGEEPELGKDYDLTSYYGEKFRVLIKDRLKKKGVPDDGKRFQHIDTIKRLKKEE